MIGFTAPYLAGMRLFLLLSLALPLLCAAQDAPADSTESVNMAIVEEVPRWPGCEAESGTAAQACTDAGVMRHVVKETKYPGKARRKGIQGQVIVRFVVERDGSVGDIKVIRPVHPLLDEEAVRVVKTFPDFSPGLQRGKPVRVSYNLPLNFALN